MISYIYRRKQKDSFPFIEFFLEKFNIFGRKIKTQHFAIFFLRHLKNYFFRYFPIKLIFYCEMDA
jgi:hypothetical protein